MKWDNALGNQVLTSSITVTGDVQAIFGALQKALSEIGFKESKTDTPNAIQLQRGKGGLLTTKIQECKTVLKVSLKESPTSDEVHILFDYLFEVPGIFTDGDRQVIEGELLKIKHTLFDISPSSTPKFFRTYKK